MESNNGIAMKKPELDIPESGWVPSHVQVFRLKMPCTGVVSSEVHVLLTINITAVNPKHGDVSLVFHRNKICLKTTDMLLDSLIGNDNIIFMLVPVISIVIPCSVISPLQYDQFSLTTFPPAYLPPVRLLQIKLRCVYMYYRYLQPHGQPNPNT